MKLDRMSRSTKLPFTMEECHQWEESTNKNPRTKRKIDPDAPHGIASLLKANCKRDHGWTAEECAMFKQNPSVNPRTQRKIMKDGPLYSSLLAACNPRPNPTTENNGLNTDTDTNTNTNNTTKGKVKQAKQVRKVSKHVEKQHDADFDIPSADFKSAKSSNTSPLQSTKSPKSSKTKSKTNFMGCSNDSDPITLEYFESMTDDAKEDLVVIGKPGLKHCMTLESAYAIYEDAIKKNKEAKDPYNPSHAFTHDEIKTILDKIRKRTPGFKSPKYVKFDIPKDLMLDFLPDMMWKFFWIIVKHRKTGGVVYDLGWMPANIEPSESGSLDIASSVQMAKIQELWETGRLFTSYVPGFMEVSPDVPIEHDQNAWMYKTRLGQMKWNMQKYNAYATALNSI